MAACRGFFFLERQCQFADDTAKKPGVPGHWDPCMKPSGLADNSGKRYAKLADKDNSSSLCVVNPLTQYAHHFAARL